MTAMRREVSQRYVRPLNQTLSHQTPGFYSQLGRIKPIFAWSMDDVLEHALHRPDCPVRVEQCLRFFADLSPRAQYRLNQSVNTCVRNHAPLLSDATEPLAIRILGLIDLLDAKAISLSPYGYNRLRHPPADSIIEFPDPPSDASCTMLYKSIWRFGMWDVLRRRRGDPPAEQQAIAYLQSLENADLLRFDHLVDTLAQEHDDRVSDVLSGLSEQICEKLRVAIDVC